MCWKPVVAWVQMRWKPIVACVLLFSLLRFVMIETGSWTAHQIFESHSAEVRNSAQTAIGPQATFDDARDWLRMAGYESVSPGADYTVGHVQHATSSALSAHLEVAGQRQFVPQNWLLIPQWIQVHFLFDERGKFQKVETTLWPWKIS